VEEMQVAAKEMTTEKELMAVATMRAACSPAKKHSVAAKTDTENGKST
jgi:hypothetical protein